MRAREDAALRGARVEAKAIDRLLSASPGGASR
jgi:hypothetical protein